MTGKLYTAAAFLFFFFNILSGQSLTDQKREYTRADSLRGSLRPSRECYDVKFYQLYIKIDTTKKTVSGSCTIKYKALSNFERIQVDLFDSMNIVNILYRGQPLQFVREYNAVFITFPGVIEKDSTGEIIINYYGRPTIAKRPPWDGGFTWNYDEKGKLWVGVSCEGMGASSWWPNKDYLGDEPDSMRVTCIVPWGLKCIANGNMEYERRNDDGTTTFSWFIGYPINNYNVTLNIGDYVQIHDEYVATDKSKLALDYYVLSYNEEKAKKHFEQVKPMLACYEKYLGKYPFWNDGYALVETPYLGMEHQGAIAYGNKYKTGYSGTDFSRIGLTFDYIVIHETAHEWWGNSVTCQDIADMWIHESFATYTEAIYVECMFDKETALKYVNAKKPTVGNKSPIVGVYGVNEEGDGDMYNKGMLFLNTLRHVVNNDKVWWPLIKNMCDTTFKIKNINYEDVLNYFNRKTGRQLGPVFEQYLKHTAIPQLEYSVKKVKKKKYTVRYRWVTDAKGFNLPVFISTNNGRDYKQVECSNEWQDMKVESGKPSAFKVNDEWMYIDVKEK